MIAIATTAPVAMRPPGLALLLRLKFRLMRNRIAQLIEQSPLRLVLVLTFVGVIWFALYGIFDGMFFFLRRFEQQSAIAIPYLFHIFFVAMTALLAFSTAVLAYGSLFGRSEPEFLLTTPHPPRDVVTILYLESLFFSSWSLVLLGVPLMLAIGHVQGLPWHFYLTFLIAFLAFVPIPGAVGLVLAMLVALWVPRLARRVLLFASTMAILALVIWWIRLWGHSRGGGDWLAGFLSELRYLKAAVLPSTWVTQAIRFAIEDRPADAAFYLCVTTATAIFMSWYAVAFASRKYLAAFGRAHSAPTATRHYSGRVSEYLTAVFFFYLPVKVRSLILKDVRAFLRDPMQWSQLAILFGLLSLYLLYLPTSRPDGFNTAWRALICFLNYGAVILILSTFTSRFVFPLISLEGRQIWLVGLWPLSRGAVIWAKFLYALTVTAIAAATVTALSVRALELPWMLATMQAVATAASCIGLCGLAVGLGARLPSYHERSSGAIASGLGGTVNLIASVGLVVLNVAMMGCICWRLAQRARLDALDGLSLLLFGGIVVLSAGTGLLALRSGARGFERQEF